MTTHTPTFKLYQGRSQAIRQVGSLRTKSGPSNSFYNNYGDFKTCMHVLANWIAELVQFLYCSIIYRNSGPFCTFKWTFLCILVDLLVDL